MKKIKAWGEDNESKEQKCTCFQFPTSKLIFFQIIHFLVIITVDLTVFKIPVSPPPSPSSHRRCFSSSCSSCSLLLWSSKRAASFPYLLSFLLLPEVILVIVCVCVVEDLSSTFSASALVFSSSPSSPQHNSSLDTGNIYKLAKVGGNLIPLQQIMSRVAAAAESE